MSDYFYSLTLLITQRKNGGSPYLSAMDLLAMAIADEEKPPHVLIRKVFDFGDAP